METSGPPVIGKEFFNEGLVFGSVSFDIIFL